MGPIYPEVETSDREASLVHIRMSDILWIQSLEHAMCSCCLLSRQGRTRAPPPRVNDSEMLASVMPPTPTPPPRRAAADVVANGSGPSSIQQVSASHVSRPGQDNAATWRQTAARAIALCTS